MILSKIMGGLGNQMFCYAAGRAVALRHGVDLKLDVSGYPDNDGRSFELNHFHITAEIASPSDLAGFHKHDSRRLWNKIMRKVMGRSYGQTKHFRQRGYAFDSEFLKIGSHARLDGLFQSELFFCPASAEIRCDLRLKDMYLNETTRDLAERMRSTESVSLHVRRTDYVRHEHYSKIVEPCSLDYYRQAVSLVRQRLGEPQIFVFSDEPDWCRAHLDLPASAAIVDANGTDRPWLDMHLMSCCQHHIVANSSFSWWGAWLGHSESQIVVAPASWLRPGCGLDDKDIVPPRWIRI